MPLHNTQTHDDIRPSPARRRWGWLPRAMGVVCLCLLLAFVGLCLFIDHYGRRDYARAADAIVILGAQVEVNHLPGDSLRARTRHAVELYKRGLAKKIICTGGLGDHAPPEAEASARLAMQLGVPAADLLLETRSHTTRENARYAATICRTYGWTHLLVVSDPYHLWRARRDFAAIGLLAYTSPAKDCYRNTHWLPRVIWTVRDGLAVARDMALYGWR